MMPRLCGPWVSSGFVLASIDTDLRVFGQRRDIESLTGSGSPTLVGMLFYGTASLRLRSR